MMFSGRSSEDNQLSTRTLCEKSESTNLEGSWKLKFIFCFMMTAHELLHFHKLSRVIIDVIAYFESLLCLMRF
jgi:hypothetical protein